MLARAVIASDTRRIADPPRLKFLSRQFGWVALCMDTEGNMFGLNSMK